MKKIIAMLILLTLTVSAQVSSKVPSDLTKHGSKSNITQWNQEFVFVDSGATRAGPFVVGESPIGVAITRDIVYDSTVVGGYLADGYHYDSSWTASDLAFEFGFKRTMNDSARTTLTAVDSIDFLPVFNSDSTRLVVQADSMRYINLSPINFAGAKYFYLNFYDSAGDSLIAQTEPRTLILFYREY